MEIHFRQNGANLIIAYNNKGQNDIMISIEEAIKFIVVNQQKKNKKEGSADKKCAGTGYMDGLE